MFIPRVHPHDDAAPDWTRQQPLPKVPHKHGDRLLLCCTGQFSPGSQKEAEEARGLERDVSEKEGGRR